MSPSLRFRWATLQDVQEVVALVQRGFRGEASRMGWTTEADLLDGQRTDLREVQGLISSATDRSRVLLALHGNQLVACAALTDHGLQTMCIGMVTVEPCLQGAGIGRRLLREAEAHVLQERRATRMRMTVIAQRPELIAW